MMNDLPEGKDSKINETILLIDGHGLAFRGFYALPEMNAPDGTPTNAVLGFMNMLLKAVDEWKPDGVGIFFDPKGPTARDEMYGAYKEGRRPTPDNFKAQLPLILELSRALGYPVFVQGGTEADDMIASTARALSRGGYGALILSADKDLLQTLGRGVRMARPSKGISDFNMYSERSFTDEYGFPPAAMADYLALVGDAVDNIPGVSGIGDKTARGLLVKYGSLDAIYGALDLLPDAQRKKLEAGREEAYRSLSLVVPLEVEPIPAELLRRTEVDMSAAYALCSRLGLKKIISRLGLEGAPEKPNISLTEARAETRAVAARDEPSDFSLDGEETLVLADGIIMTEDGEWRELAGARETLEAWAERAKRGGENGKKLILAGYGAWCEREQFLAECPEIIRDAELAHYFLHPDAKSHFLNDMLPDKYILGAYAGSNAALAAEILSLWRELSAAKYASNMEKVMTSIDAPLVPVLAELSANGLFTDVNILTELDAELRARIGDLERGISDAAGGSINLNSPKQVGELLFERLGLPVIKKTKTGASTDMEVLDELSRLPEPMCRVPSMLLEFREYSKMSSGFVEPFIHYAERSPDHRIRSTFLHTATGTGRLASRDPNVQNLPVFGEWAEKFRSAIKPADGLFGGKGVYVAADYSQIELRVLAHLSGEERLVESFAGNRDIHSETASWVFGAAPEDITQEQRRFAKTVNFGLIYGMGAHGLAARMGITRYRAVELIDKYFSVLPKVRDYLTNSALSAKERGFTESIFGRVRPLAEVTTTEGRGGASMDRVAVNTPIQSAASDIAKIAMIKLDKALDKTRARMALQVHDSLICETSEEFADEVEALLVKTMEGIECLNVPLKAVPKRGRTLAEV
ncbi:DNA polymerase [Synergistales bacterium]|nr:DNA polymerase [Synergistales bacterium]